MCARQQKEVLGMLDEKRKRILDKISVAFPNLTETEMEKLEISADTLILLGEVRKSNDCTLKKRSPTNNKGKVTPARL